MNKSNSFYLKRRKISSKECQYDLKNYIELIFQSFNQAIELYEKEIIQTPTAARDKLLQATLLRSKIIQCIQDMFPDNWKYGKYRRFVLRICGYNILFKKLNKYNMPMNINTKNNQLIVNQIQYPTLFDDPKSCIEPIIYFGYKLNNFGIIIESSLVYIDEGKLSWQITRDEIGSTCIKSNINTEEIITPKLRNNTSKKLVN